MIRDVSLQRWTMKNVSRELSMMSRVMTEHWRHDRGLADDIHCKNEDERLIDDNHDSELSDDRSGARLMSYDKNDDRMDVIAVITEGWGCSRMTIECWMLTDDSQEQGTQYLFLSLTDELIHSYFRISFEIPTMSV